MTYEEIKAAVEELPVAERLRLVEAVSRSVREILEATVTIGNGAHDTDEAWRKDFEAERARLLKDIPQESSAHRTFGMLRAPARPPTDEEIREDYTNYLMRKHA